jgi:hypothetical protein
MKERKPDTGSDWLVMVAAVWASRMGVENKIARTQGKARLCPSMLQVRQFNPRKDIGKREFIEVSDR